MRREKTSFLLIIFLATTFLGCQKELDFEDIPVPPPLPKPKVGTRWVYRYTTFYSSGGVNINEDVVYEAKSIDTLGGEPWLNIQDKNGATVFLFWERTDGLYQYTTSGSQILCKYPAVIDDQYQTFNRGSMEDFYVKAVDDTLRLSDDHVVNYYEGKKLLSTVNPPKVFIIDKLWYNPSVWLAKQEYWNKTQIITPYYRRYQLLLKSITY